MTRVMFGTPIIIGNYEGTCLKCGGPLKSNELQGIYLGENVVNHAVRIKITSMLFCMKCYSFVSGAEIYNIEWQPYMFARCN